MHFIIRSTVLSLFLVGAAVAADPAFDIAKGVEVTANTTQTIFAAQLATTGTTAVVLITEDHLGNLVPVYVEADLISASEAKTFSLDTVIHYGETGLTEGLLDMSGEKWGKGHEEAFVLNMEPEDFGFTDDADVWFHIVGTELDFDTSTHTGFFSLEDLQETAQSVSESGKEVAKSVKNWLDPVSDVGRDMASETQTEMNDLYDLITTGHDGEPDDTWTQGARALIPIVIVLKNRLMPIEAGASSSSGFNFSPLSEVDGWVALLAPDGGDPANDSGEEIDPTDINGDGVPDEPHDVDPAMTSTGDDSEEGTGGTRDDDSAGGDDSDGEGTDADPMHREEEDEDEDEDDFNNETENSGADPDTDSDREGLTPVDPQTGDPVVDEKDCVASPGVECSSEGELRDRVDSSGWTRLPWSEAFGEAGPALVKSDLVLDLGVCPAEDDDLDDLREPTLEEIEPVLHGLLEIGAGCPAPEMTMSISTALGLPLHYLP